MKTFHSSAVILAAGVLGLAACNNSTAPVASIFSDSTVTANVTNTSGEAVAADYADMLGSENYAGMTAPVPVYPVTTSFTVNRTKTCYDGNGVVVTNCMPIATVRKVVTHLQADGSIIDTTSTSPLRIWSGAAHHLADDTIIRNFNTAVPPVETSRVHSGNGTGHDSTSFTGDTVSFKMDEAAHDRFNAVTFNLPRTTPGNQYPVSGSIMRTDTVTATFTKGSTSETRTVVRTVEVDFPADANGNVNLLISGKTCTLNLNTHKVTNCH